MTVLVYGHVDVGLAVGFGLATQLGESLLGELSISDHISRTQIMMNHIKIAYPLRESLLLVVAEHVDYPVLVILVHGSHWLLSLPGNI